MGDWLIDLLFSFLFGEVVAQAIVAGTVTVIGYTVWKLRHR